jgi:hypothetical protein
LLSPLAAEAPASFLLLLPALLPSPVLVVVVLGVFATVPLAVHLKRHAHMNISIA